MTRILVFGGRDYQDKRRAYQVLDAAMERLGLSVVIHGAAKGADSHAKAWAKYRGIPDDPYPANWDDLTQPGARIKTRPDGSRYDAAEGGRRNQRMIDKGKPDAAIGFPGGDGSRDMLKRCRTAGIEPHLIDWSG